MLDSVPETCKVLTLNNTRVTAEGLKKLAGKVGIEWINLTCDESHPSLIIPDGIKEIETLGTVKVRLEVLTSFECE